MKFVEEKYEICGGMIRLGGRVGKLI